MKILIAGATGAIGNPLLKYLKDAGHKPFALVRSPKAAGALGAKSTEEVVADALDAASVLQVVKHINPDVIINELTSLPKVYTRFAAACMNYAGLEQPKVAIGLATWEMLRPCENRSICVTASWQPYLRPAS